MMEKITKVALASRVFLILIQMLSNAILPDHEPDVFRSPVGEDDEPMSCMDKIIEFCLGGLRHWDAEYFLHIAKYNYSYEHTLAFFPLFPIIVHTIAYTLHIIGLGLSMRSWILLVAVSLNTYIFCETVNLVYAITQRIFNDINKSWNAALLFCINPASIFFTAAYSEPIFCWLTLHLMQLCLMDSNIFYSTSTLALSILARSNGLINIGFPVYFTLRRIILQQLHRYTNLVKLFFSLFCAVLPLTMYYSYAFQMYCKPDMVIDHPSEIVAYAKERQYVLSGQRLPENSPWCENLFPFPYSYVQSHYWNVGFLRYYEWKQIPNFLLAMPTLGFLYYHCFIYLKSFVCEMSPKFTMKYLLQECKLLPFVLHALFLTIFCTLFVHIQISTRLLCSASPCLYWFAADYMPKSMYQMRLRSKCGCIISWFIAYSIIGTVLFSNNLPWT